MMPWKQGYTISDERSLADSEIRWPDGAHCCLAITVDLSVASGPEGVTAADLATPEALFGANHRLGRRFGARGCYRRRPRDARGVVWRQSGSRCVARDPPSTCGAGDLRGSGGDRAYPS